ncbi:damage-control phosphatase ARMT1 family protein [Methanobacterium spitsbergense]|uniref:ARMT1-like domain-containing protein n=1 Tax=Methanobacterium spitsbergense TaxID=2874285 RepID=A0A8T5UL88_9EURY|nr:ARMT1-like domain-containing protein [Methanobacterium spitsbergense]MBZ2164648.1 ARMT1-like domain-containing protein [Methanobacterium spitsbergense]
MKVHYECAACFLRQTREALDLATNNDSLKMEVTEKVVKIVSENFHIGAVSNVIGTEVHRTIKQETGNKDPYSKEREISNDIAMDFLPKVEKILGEEKDLKSCIKVAIAGNVIDFGALGLDTDMESLIIKTMGKNPTLDHSKELESELNKCKTVLYLADNIGEIVFDKILIEKLVEYDVEVTVALKEKPILNDACIEDALKIGLNDLAKLTTTGTDSIGVIEQDVSAEFMKLFHESDMVIAKGLGNYEGLGEMDLKMKPVFCLLNAKCRPVARDIGVDLGDNIVLMLSNKS